MNFRHSKTNSLFNFACQLSQLCQWNILKSNYSVYTFKYGDLLAEHIKKNWSYFLIIVLQFKGVAKLAPKSYYSL